MSDSANIAFPTAALLGSFRQHYLAILDSWKVLSAEGIRLTTPLGSPVTRESSAELFVRFESDDPSWSDEMVETVAMHRIFSADAVYVVAPSGYIGRTTCYEVGRAIQARRPVYFSESPLDLPLSVPNSPHHASAGLRRRPHNPPGDTSTSSGRRTTSRPRGGVGQREMAL